MKYLVRPYDCDFIVGSVFKILLPVKRQYLGVEFLDHYCPYINILLQTEVLCKVEQVKLIIIEHGYSVDLPIGSRLEKIGSFTVHNSSYTLFEVHS